MRIAIGSMLHESTTFSCLPTDLNGFRQTQYLSGEEMVAYHEGKRTEPGGMLEVLRKAGAVVLPTLSAWAIPSGVVTRETYAAIKAEIVEPIRKNRDQLDGVLLALHGAMVVDGLEDPEGDLIQAVRAVVGEVIYMGVSLDMHAHLTQRMVDHADFFVAYRTHPHVDQYETGWKTAQILLRAIQKKLKFSKAFILLPLMAPGENRDETRAQLIGELESTDRQPGVVSSLAIISHPWSDLSIQGDSVLVVTENGPESAQRYARQIAQKFWDLRYDFPLDLYSIQQAVKIGLETKKKGPTVICEMGDCLMGGASGDVMTSLSYLMQRGAKGVAVAVVVDPGSVSKAEKAGIGNTVSLQLGGKLFKEGNPPLPFEGQVKFIGKDIEGEGQNKINIGYETKMGRMAVVEGHGVEVVIVERPGKIGDPSFFRAFGIAPEKKRFIILKDSIGPLISYRGIASNVLLVYTPGWCNHLLATINYKKVPRPIFPLDPTLSWSPK